MRVETQLATLLAVRSRPTFASRNRAAEPRNGLRVDFRISGGAAASGNCNDAMIDVKKASRKDFNPEGDSGFEQRLRSDRSAAARFFLEKCGLPVAAEAGSRAAVAA